MFDGQLDRFGEAYLAILVVAITLVSTFIDRNWRSVRDKEVFMATTCERKKTNGQKEFGLRQRKIFLMCTDKCFYALVESIVLKLWSISHLFLRFGRILIFWVSVEFLIFLIFSWIFFSFSDLVKLLFGILFN